MAATRTRPTRLRLTFNFRTGAKTTEKIRGFGAVLVQEVAINASDEMWHEIVAKIERKLEADVFREISKMAQLFKQYVIGISGTRSGLYGTLTPASQFASGMSSQARYRLNSGPAGSWPPRSRDYLRRKAKPHDKGGVGHIRWFEYSGLLSRNMGRGSFWTDTFGPVKVEVRRHTSMSPSDARNIATSQGNKTAQSQYMRRFDAGAPSISGYSMRVNVASIRVAALDTITPAMLPALLNDDISDMPADGRRTGLIGKFPKEVAEHLAGSSQHENFVPYRHTIEPFLGFYLTRAIPNAVMRRIQDGLGANTRFIPETRGDSKFVNPL